MIDRLFRTNSARFLSLSILTATYGCGSDGDPADTDERDEATMDGGGGPADSGAITDGGWGSDSGFTEDGGMISDSGVTADGGSTADGGAMADSGASPLPNAKSEGDWKLSTAGATCGINFNEGFIGRSFPESEDRFALELPGGKAALSCIFKATEPSEFTCNSWMSGGQIYEGCYNSWAITDITGTVVGNAVDISATVQRTSSGSCGSTLNCGPLPHAASGTIVP